MSLSAKWSLILDNDAMLRAILTGEAEIPDSKTGKDLLQESLACALRSAREIYSGELEMAAQHLAAAPHNNRSCCLRLIRYWLQVETDAVQVYYLRLSRFMARLERMPRRYAFMLKSRLEIRDYRAARRWAPVLRLYMASLLPEISSQVLQTARNDLQTCDKNGIDLDLQLYLQYSLRFARARQKHNVDEIVTAMASWHQLSGQDSKMNIGHDFYLETALILEIESRYAEALSWIERGLEKLPHSYDFLLAKARITKRSGNFRHSLASCDMLVHNFPEDYAGYCLRSNINFLLGNYKLAMGDANKACSLAPVSADAYMARAFVYLQMGEFSPAMLDFKQVIAIEPLRYEALRGYGKCLSMLGRDWEAMACFTSMRRQWPDDPDIYYELADIMFAAGYLEDCVRMCRQCLNIDSTYVSAYVILGLVALRRNDDETAGHLLTRAVALEPDNPFALNELSYLKHLEGDDDLAIELVNRAIEESPEYHDALCNKGVILYYRSEFEQAVQVFDQALQQEPEQTAAWIGKGNALVQMSSFEEALGCYDEALSIEPDNAEACHAKAVLYRMIGLDDEVRIWQERALRLDPDIEDI